MTTAISLICFALCGFGFGRFLWHFGQYVRLKAKLLWMETQGALRKEGWAACAKWMSTTLVHDPEKIFSKDALPIIIQPKTWCAHKEVLLNKDHRVYQIGVCQKSPVSSCPWHHCDFHCSLMCNTANLGPHDEGTTTTVKTYLN